MSGASPRYNPAVAPAVSAEQLRPPGGPAGLNSGASVTYRVQTDNVYLLEVMRRVDRAAKGKWVRRAAAGVILVLMASAVVITAVSSTVAHVTFTLAMNGAGLVIWKYLHHMMLWQTRKLRGPPEEIAYVVSREGYHGRSLGTDVSVQWSVVTRAVRFSDGLLLSQGMAVAWLPDSACVDGSSPAVATEFAKTAVADFEVIS